MLDFLNDYFTKEELVEIKNNFKGAEAFNLYANQDSIIEIIKYLKTLDLNIKDLLIEKPDIFYKDLYEIKELFIEEIN